MIKSYFETKFGKLYNANCLGVLKQMLSNSIDTIITDPPYALEFMGKGWDKVLPSFEIWKEALRIAKPGATFLCFGGDRTHHRLMVNIEDAGWVIRTCVYWIFGSGFPKSLNIGKAIDKLQGNKREELGIHKRTGKETGVFGTFTGNNLETKGTSGWDGWGTALKPAAEIIVVAIKPLNGTFAENALKHGVAGLNIDGGRIFGPEPHHNYGRTSGESSFVGKSEKPVNTPPQGRYPANIILDEEAGKLLDLQSGILNSHAGQGKYDDFTDKNCYGDGWKRIVNQESSQGGASRFFYCAKASKSERNAGLSGNKQRRDESRSHGQAGTDNPYPLSLIKYLCKLTETPTKGIVLDPFFGSGTTGIACERLNRRWIGIEISGKYCEIAAKRIDSLKFGLQQIKKGKRKEGLLY
jgi:site-specific DNA-methyltransferase (adenine-specific)